MLNKKQQNLIEQNLKTIIIENKAKMMSEFMHSPEMYKILIENKIKERPQEEQILPVLFECALTDEIFIKKHLGTLLKENLSRKEKEIISNDIIEGILGTVWKGVKKGLGWLWDQSGKVGKMLPNSPRRRPGRWGDDFMPTWRRPDGTWQTWDPNMPHWPGPPRGPFGGPGSSSPDIGPPPMVPDYSQPPIPHPFWNLPPEE